mmetsp:Transcript_36260/g.107060  ORF Transcript_36260/g.107060 Transcript_36260/m.107060 type:complete len:226 (+) Transcript_36260:1267-1944(+)
MQVGRQACHPRERCRRNPEWMLCVAPAAGVHVRLPARSQRLHCGPAVRMLRARLGTHPQHAPEVRLGRVGHKPPKRLAVEHDLVRQSQSQQRVSQAHVGVELEATVVQDDVDAAPAAVGRRRRLVDQSAPHRVEFVDDEEGGAFAAAGCREGCRVDLGRVNQEGQVSLVAPQGILHNLVQGVLHVLLGPRHISLQQLFDRSAQVGDAAARLFKRCQFLGLERVKL